MSVKQTRGRTLVRDYSIQALQRGLSTLDAVLEARTPLTLEQVCAKTGLPKATAFRIILNLVRSGYLVETEDGYWLGLKLLRFGALVEDRLDLKEQASPFLERLLDELNETVHLAVFDDVLRVVYLEKLTPRRAVGIIMSKVGVTSPMHCTGLGKAMAAFRPEGEIREYVRTHGLERYTDTTITDEDEFLRELQEIRSRGYATDNGEHAASVRCIAAPIRDRSGAVIGAISIAGPDTRMPTPLIDSPMALRIVETGQQISQILGYLGTDTVSSSARIRR